MKSLLIAALVVSLQAALDASPASSPEALADAYIISLTADGVLPVDLLHGPCVDTLSKEQQEFFDSLASTTLFSPDEFRYEISDTISPRSNRINYCVPPEKEIVAPKKASIPLKISKKKLRKGCDLDQD